jgi:cysteine desulfurase family protein (TIGR01976 family)
MTYDVAALRARFPALKDGTAYFDGPGGTQVPDVVAEAVAHTLTAGISNRGQVTAAERAADDVVYRFRSAAADLVGAEPGAVVYGRSATALTYDLARTLARGWDPGDEVVVTRLDHDANIRPWLQAAERAGAVVRWADFDPASGELPVAAVAAQLSDRTRLVAVTGASNLLGTRPDVRAVAEAAHAVGALVHVDGVHLTAHAPVDIRALGCDTYVWSPYKLLGPHCGVLTGRRGLLEELRPDKLLPSSDAVPERFELGTLPYELMAGVTAAVDLVAGLAGDDPDTPAGRRERLLTAMAAVEAHEDRLRERVEAGLTSLPGVIVHSRASHRTPTLLATFAGRPATDAYRALAAVGVNAPAGSFYAVEASRHLGLGDAGGLRVGLSPYSIEEDVDRLLEGLADFLDSGTPRLAGDERWP